MSTPPSAPTPERILQRLDWQVIRRLDGLLQLEQLLGGQHLVHSLENAGHPLDDDEFFGRARIADQHLEHEAIDLRFR